MLYQSFGSLQIGTYIQDGRNHRFHENMLISAKASYEDLKTALTNLRNMTPSQRDLHESENGIFDIMLLNDFQNGIIPPIWSDML